MVERDHWLDPLGEQFVHQALVEVEPLCVDRPGALREHARPGDAEPIGLEPELAHQRDVLPEAPVVVAGHVPRVAVAHPPGRVREAVPDARTGPVAQRRAFDLIGRSRRAPEEMLRKGHVSSTRRTSGASSRRCAVKASSGIAAPPARYGLSTRANASGRPLRTMSRGEQPCLST